MATTTPEPGQLYQAQRPTPGAPVLAEEVRDNFTALAANNYIEKADPTLFPAVPFAGMHRTNATDPNNVKEEVWLPGSGGGGGGAWKTISQKVQLGVPNPAKVVVQLTVAANVWTIDHNLGSLPLVQVLSDALIQLQNVPAAPGADQYILQHVITPLVQRVIVTFSAPRTGWIIIVG